MATPGFWSLEGGPDAIAVEHEPSAGGGFVLGRRLLGPDFVYVSRSQALLFPPPAGATADDDATIVLESLNTKPLNPTGVQRGGGSEWLWLTHGQTATLRAGDAIALDKKLKVGTVLTLRRASTAACGGDPSAATASESAEAAAASPAPTGGARSARWFYGGASSWSRYSAEQEGVIEAAWAARAARVDIDAERHIDFEALRQVRNDNPSRWRPVMRQEHSDADPHSAPRPPKRARVGTPAGDAREGALAHLAPGHADMARESASLAAAAGATPTAAAALVGGTAAALPAASLPSGDHAAAATAAAGAAGAAAVPFAPPPTATPTTAPTAAPTAPTAAPTAAPTVPADVASAASSLAASGYLGVVPPLDPSALLLAEVGEPTGASWGHAHSALLYRHAHEPPRDRVAGCVHAPQCACPRMHAPQCACPRMHAPPGARSLRSTPRSSVSIRPRVHAPRAARAAPPPRVRPHAHAALLCFRIQVRQEGGARCARHPLEIRRDRSGPRG